MFLTNSCFLQEREGAQNLLVKRGKSRFREHIDNCMRFPTSRLKTLRNQAFRSNGPGSHQWGKPVGITMNTTKKFWTIFKSEKLMSQSLQIFISRYEVITQSVIIKLLNSSVFQEAKALLYLVPRSLQCSKPLRVSLRGTKWTFSFWSMLSSE